MPNPNPFMRLLRSSKFWLAVFALVQAVVLEYFEIPDSIWQSIIGLVAVLIASIAYEDGQAKGAPTTVTAGGDASVTTLERKE